MAQLWKRRDPLDLYEKFLSANKLWDAKTKKEIDARIAHEIQADLEFAENSPFPPPELAEQGVYCEGCHTVEADWKRPKEEVTPPRFELVKREMAEERFRACSTAKLLPASAAKFSRRKAELQRIEAIRARAVKDGAKYGTKTRRGAMATAKPAPSPSRSPRKQRRP